MKEVWRNYTVVFKKLICAGFLIFKNSKSSVYTWVYPYTSIPTKYKIKEAYGIYQDANKFNHIAGSISFIPIHFNIVYTNEDIWREEIGRDKGCEVA